MIFISFCIQDDAKCGKGEAPERYMAYVEEPNDAANNGSALNANWSNNP